MSCSKANKSFACVQLLPLVNSSYLSEKRATTTSGKKANTRGFFLGASKIFIFFSFLRFASLWMVQLPFSVSFGLRDNLRYRKRSKQYILITNRFLTFFVLFHERLGLVKKSGRRWRTRLEYMHISIEEINIIQKNSNTRKKQCIYF